MKYIIFFLLLSQCFAEGEDPCAQTCPSGQVMVSLLVGEGGLQCYCSAEATMDETVPEVTSEMTPEDGAA